MSGQHVLLNKHLSNTPPLKSLGKTTLKQQFGTFDMCSLHFRELLPFKSFCLRSRNLKRQFQQLELPCKAVLDAIRLLQTWHTDVFSPTADYFHSEMLSAFLKNSSVWVLLYRCRHLLFPPLWSSYFPHSACIFDTHRKVSYNCFGQTSKEHAEEERHQK